MSPLQILTYALAALGLIALLGFGVLVWCSIRFTQTFPGVFEPAKKG